MPDKPTLEEVLLRKAEEIGPGGQHDAANNPGNWKLGMMPTTPAGLVRGPLGRLLGLNKGPSTILGGSPKSLYDVLMGRVVASDDPSLMDIGKEYWKSAMTNAAGSIFQGLKPQIQEAGFPTTWDQLAHKPWMKYQMDKLSGHDTTNPLTVK